MPRPRLLTQEVQHNIANALRMGAYANDCAYFAGVSPKLHYNWMDRGRRYEQHLEDGGEPDPGEEMYLEYLVECEQARAEARIVAVGAISKQVRDPGTYYPGWRAGVEFLRRTDPANWDQLGAHKIELTGKDGGPVQFEVTELETRLSSSLSEALPRLREVAAAGDDGIVDAEIIEDRSWDGTLTTDDTGTDYVYAQWTAFLSSDLTEGL